jgi:hypothetical protein
MNNKEFEALRLARLVLERPEAWTQYGYAHDASGRRVDWDSLRASSWCVVGAVRLASKELFPHICHDVAFMVTRELNAWADANTKHSGVIAWQDSPERSHDEVLEMLDDCIYRALTSPESA